MFDLFHLSPFTPFSEAGTLPGLDAYVLRPRRVWLWEPEPLPTSRDFTDFTVRHQRSTRRTERAKSVQLTVLSLRVITPCELQLKWCLTQVEHVSWPAGSHGQVYSWRGLYMFLDVPGKQFTWPMGMWKFWIRTSYIVTYIARTEEIAGFLPDRKYIGILPWRQCILSERPVGRPCDVPCQMFRSCLKVDPLSTVIWTAPTHQSKKKSHSWHSQISQISQFHTVSVFSKWKVWAPLPEARAHAGGLRDNDSEQCRSSCTLKRASAASQFWQFTCFSLLRWDETTRTATCKAGADAEDCNTKKSFNSCVVGCCHCYMA